VKEAGDRLPTVGCTTVEEGKAVGGGCQGRVEGHGLEIGGSVIDGSVDQWIGDR
jgi:hypothetical protein